MDKSSRERFHTIWTIAILFCVVLALFAVLLPSCTKAVETEDASIETTEEETDVTTEEEEDIYATYFPAATPEPSTLLEESADQGEDYISQMMFLGDTTIYDLISKEVLSEDQVLSTANGTLSLSNQGTTYVVYHDEDGSDREMLVPDAVALAQPEYLVITLGLKDINSLSERQFKLLYTQLIQSIQSASPDTKIICQSIFPVIEEDADLDVDNSDIEEANGWILEVAGSSSVRYLNTSEVFLNSSGQLGSEFCSGDGIHLSSVGGETMLEYIRTHAYV